MTDQEQRDQLKQAEADLSNCLAQVKDWQARQAAPQSPGGYGLYRGPTEESDCDGKKAKVEQLTAILAAGNIGGTAAAGAEQSGPEPETGPVPAPSVRRLPPDYDPMDVDHIDADNPLTGDTDYEPDGEGGWKRPADWSPPSKPPAQPTAVRTPTPDPTATPAPPPGSLWDRLKKVFTGKMPLIISDSRDAQNADRGLSVEPADSGTELSGQGSAGETTAPRDIGARKHSVD